MTRHGTWVLIAVLVGATLTACADFTTPESSPTSTDSATPSSTATPSESSTPSATPSGQPTESEPPPAPNPAPEQVQGLTTSMGGGSGEVLLRWAQSPEPDVVSYVVFRALSPGGARTRLGTVTRQQVAEFEYVPFVDSEATVAYYSVRAVDNAGQDGPRSAEVCGASVGYSC